MKNRKNADAIGVLINDVHLNKDNGDLVKDIFRQVISVCKKYDTPNLLCGGDVFTNRSGQPLQCLTDWKEILDSLRKNNIFFYGIAGNHDKTDSCSDKSYLDIYSQNNVCLYRHADYINLDGFRNDCIIAFIPYYEDQKWLEEFQKLERKIDDDINRGEINDNEAKFLLITHMAIDGVKNNDGSSVSSCLKTSLFNRWDKVLVGHYHNASKIAKNIYYTGSAYQGNFGETITDKGFTVLFSDGSIEHVASEFPHYIREDVDVNDKENLKNLIEKYDGDDYNHIRFVFHGKKADCEKISIADIQSHGIDCKFVSVEEKEAIELSESDSVLEYTQQSLKKDFVKFCSLNHITGKEFKYGFDLFK